MIVARIKGGLGNQLFIYAAARGISSKHNIPLKFDTISGSIRDYYQRGKSVLHHFNVNIETCSHYDSYIGHFGRFRRVINRNISNCFPMKYRIYINESKESGKIMDEILKNKPIFDVYLDGYWQSEKYFKHIETEIRKEMIITTQHDAENIVLAETIRNENAICVHVRRLHGVGNVENQQPLTTIQSLGMKYYNCAINYMIKNVKNPVFFFFADCPQWLQDNINISYPGVFVTHNTVSGEAKNYEDLWLMTQCKHFIIADSTFSWWGAWLCENTEKIVCAPRQGYRFNQNWIPEDWHVI